MELTLKINNHTKIGKTLLNLIEIFAKENKEVEIVSKTKEESPYNPEFVKMIKAAEKNAEYTTIDTDDVWGSLGLK